MLETAEVNEQSPHLVYNMGDRHRSCQIFSSELLQGSAGRIFQNEFAYNKGNWTPSHPVPNAIISFSTSYAAIIHDLCRELSFGKRRKTKVLVWRAPGPLLDDAVTMSLWV